METDREGWRQGVREYWAVRRGVSAEPSSPFVVVGAGYVLVVVVVRWRCRPLALSVGVVIGVGVVRGRWRRPWALASSVGVGVVRWHRHWRWRRPWALASSVGIGVVIGVGVVRWRWRCPLASLALSVGVVHWLVNSCERTWALVTVVGASGMGVVRCRLSSMVVLVSVGRVARGCRGCGCG